MELKNYSLASAIRQIATNKRLIQGPEKEAHQIANEQQLFSVGRKISAPNQFVFPSGNHEERSAITTNEVSGNGVLDFIPAIYSRSFLTSLGAKLIPGISGNQKIPVSEGVTANWLSETEENSVGTPGINGLSIAPHRLSVVLYISQRLLIQNPQSEKILKDEAIKAITAGLNKAAISGSGASNEPQGILYNPDVNLITGGANGASLTDRHLFEMEKEVELDEGNRGRMAFVINPDTKNHLQILQVDGGSINVWDRLYHNRLIGYPAEVTNSAPNNLSKGSGTGLSGLLLGNFEDLHLYQFGNFEFTVNPFTFDTKGIIEITIDSFWDIVLTRPGSFSKMVDAITE